MYPLVRLVRSTLFARFRSQLTPHQCSEFSFRVRPWDIDMFLELNNGRLLTLFDLGRFDLATRVGLARELKANKWGLVVAGSTVRYRKRIRMFNKVTIRTQLIAVDERWFYLQQTALAGGVACASALLRTAVTKAGRLHPVAEVASKIKVDLERFTPELWCQKWIDLEELREWPPRDRAVE